MFTELDVNNLLCCSFVCNSHSSKAFPLATLVFLKSNLQLRAIVIISKNIAQVYFYQKFNDFEFSDNLVSLKVSVKAKILMPKLITGTTFYILIKHCYKRPNFRL